MGNRCPQVAGQLDGHIPFWRLAGNSARQSILRSNGYIQLQRVTCRLLLFDEARTAKSLAVREKWPATRMMRHKVNGAIRF
jgi:hypothetical protein